MSSIKCPNCNLTNFATAQFCKRCNLALTQLAAGELQNNTQILNPADNTHIRQAPPVRPTNQAAGNQPFYQNGQPPYPQGAAAPNYGQDYQQNNQQNYQQNNQQNYQQNNYRQQPYQQRPYHQPPYQQEYYQQAGDYSLPKFPKGQRPSQYDYQNAQYQHAPVYRSSEVAFRRIGNEIVLHKQSSLPEACMACGKKLSPYDGDAFVAQKLRWHHPAVYAALISPLIYLILALCLSERFTVDVPLCREHIKSRESTLTGLIVGGLLWAVFIVFCFMMESFGLGVLVFLFGLIVLTMVNEYGYKAVRVKKIEGTYYHLTGASQEFLNTLPR